MVSVIYYLPAFNTLTGLIFYTLCFYLLMYALTYCLQPTGFDIESHRARIIKAREEREAKAKRILGQREYGKNKHN